MCGVALVREENKIPVFFPCTVYVKIRIIKIVQKATLQIITMYSNTVILKISRKTFGYKISFLKVLMFLI